MARTFPETIKVKWRDNTSMNDVDRVRQEVKRLQARHGLHVPAGTQHNIHYAKSWMDRIRAFVSSACWNPGQG